MHLCRVHPVPTCITNPQAPCVSVTTPWVYRNSFCPRNTFVPIILGSKLTQETTIRYWASLAPIHTSCASKQKFVYILWFFYILTYLTVAKLVSVRKNVRRSKSGAKAKFFVRNQKLCIRKRASWQYLCQQAILMPVGHKCANNPYLC